MTKKSARKNSQMWGEKGGFYFSPIVMTLKKFFLAAERFLQRSFAQAAVEYFILLTAMLALALISTSFFLPRTRGIFSDFFSDATNAIMTDGAAAAASCAAGGVQVQDPSGYTFCRYNVHCPSGWAQYQNWSGTQSQTCTSSLVNGPCMPDWATTGSHGWANRPVEIEMYYDEVDEIPWGSGNCVNRMLLPCQARITTIGCIPVY